MTLPSEGINPWRTIPAHSGSIDTSNRLPTENLLETDPENSLKDVDAAGSEFKPFGDDGFTFRDFVDIVNPLQHIPVISTVYRNMTEDQLDPMPRILGGTLFLGPIGLAASVANVMVEHSTGKDLGDHVMAYFRDDAAPLKADNRTSPAAAGTDGVDPVTAWAQEQNAFYQKGAAPVANGNADISVEAWAQAQNKFYRDGAPIHQQHAATGPVDVAAWATAQQAYYRRGPHAPAVAAAAATGTSGTDPVTAWAQAQTAAYGSAAHRDQPSLEFADTGTTAVAAGTDGIDPITAWARAQTAAYTAPATANHQVATIDRAETQAATATAVGASGVNPVTAQTAAYTAPADVKSQHQTIELAEPRTTPVAAGTDGIDPVTAWAQAQLAWVHGDRAREIAATAPTRQAPSMDRSTVETPARGNGAAQSGAVADNGGWFRDNMVAGWTKYHAAQQLANPAHQPTLAVPGLRR